MVINAMKGGGGSLQRYFSKKVISEQRVEAEKGVNCKDNGGSVSRQRVKTSTKA